MQKLVKGGNKLSDKIFNWSKIKNAPQTNLGELDNLKKVSRMLPIAECFVKFAKKYLKIIKIPLRKVLLVTLRNEV